MSLNLVLTTTILYCVNVIYGRIGIVIPNPFELGQLLCISPDFPCADPDVFTLEDEFDLANHRFYEGFIGCPEAKVTITMSGLATINAALTTQLLIDVYSDEYDPIDFIITYGIAGGINDALNIGDVVVASKWSIYNLWSWQRQGDDENDPLPLEEFGDYTRDVGFWQAHDTINDLNRIWFQPQEVFRDTPEVREHKLFFDADPNSIDLMIDIAEDIEADLHDCVDADRLECLEHKPRIITSVDGKPALGLTGDIFVDNSKWRDILLNQFNDAECIDMETGAVAMVCDSNNIPFIAFRSLSDLAGGSGQANQIGTFLQIGVKNSVVVLEDWMIAMFCADRDKYGRKGRKRGRAKRRRRRSKRRRERH